MAPREGLGKVSCPGSSQRPRQDRVRASRQGTDPGSLRSLALGGWVVISRKAKDFIRSFKNHSGNCVGQIQREQPGGQAGSGYILRLKWMSLGEGLGGGTEEMDRPLTARCVGPEAAHQLQQERMCRMCVNVHTCWCVHPWHVQGMHVWHVYMHV